MAAKICNKPKNSCNTCEYFKLDVEKGCKVCYMPTQITFEDYKKAIANNDMELAREMYNLFFKK